MRKCRRTFGAKKQRRQWFADDSCVCDDDVGTKIDQSSNIDLSRPLFEHAGDETTFLDMLERRLQRRFLREHVTPAFRPKFISGRRKRGHSEAAFAESDLRPEPEVAEANEFDVAGVYELYGLLERSGLKATANDSESSDDTLPPLLSTEATFSATSGPRSWRRKKERLDKIISKLQSKLFELKTLRKQLRQQGRAKNAACSCQRSPWHDQRKKDKKMRRKLKFAETECNYEKMNCFTHDNDHWKTAPFWTCKFAAEMHI